MNGPLVEELAAVPEIADALAAFSDQPGLILFDSALVREPTGRFASTMVKP